MVQMFKKSEHWDYFSSSIQTLFAEGMFCDVTLMLENKRFPANRMLLSGCSEYFKTIFTESIKEKNSKDSEDLSVDNVKADILDSLIKFCSTGALEINSENAEGLLRGAHFLQFPIAILICCEFILKALSPMNCLKYWIVAKHLALKDFEAHIFRYCLANFRDISNLTIKTLSHEEIIEIVSNRELDIQSEQDAFNVIMNWIGHEPETRTQHISQLATCIDFNLVKQSVFTKHIAPLRQFNNTQGFLYDMMNFYFSLTKTYNPLIPTPRNSSFAPISLSAAGFQYYHERTASWLPPNGSKLELIKNKKVLAAHVFKHNFYIVSERKGENIIIETFDLRNNSLVSTFANIPYKSAATTISFPMVYLVGSENTFCGFDLLKMKKIEFPKAKSVFGDYPGVVVSGEELYVFGGEIKKSTNELYPCIHMPVQSQSYEGYADHGGFASALSNAIQKRYKSCCKYPHPPRIERTIHKSTKCFSFEKKTWMTCAPMINALSDMGIAALNGKIYVLGGATAIGNKDNQRTISTSTQCFQCYDPITDRWSTLSRFVTTCHSMKMCVWNDKLLVTGKLMASENFASTDKAVYLYDPESDVWEQKSSLRNASTYLFISSIDLFLEE